MTGVQTCALPISLGIADTIIWRLGYQPEDVLLSYLLAADAVLLPYRDFDSSSGAITLAGWSGSPVLASDLPGLTLPGHNGWVRLPPLDAAAWANALKGLQTAPLDDATRSAQLDAYAAVVASQRQDVADAHWATYATALNNKKFCANS